MRALRPETQNLASKQTIAALCGSIRFMRRRCSQSGFYPTRARCRCIAALIDRRSIGAISDICGRGKTSAENIQIAAIQLARLG